MHTSLGEWDVDGCSRHPNARYIAGHACLVTLESALLPQNATPTSLVDIGADHCHFRRIFLLGSVA